MVKRLETRAKQSNASIRPVIALASAIVDNNHDRHATSQPDGRATILQIGNLRTGHRRATTNEQEPTHRHAPACPEGSRYDARPNHVAACVHAARCVGRLGGRLSENPSVRRFLGSFKLLPAAARR
jgi:hypothetical protein